MVIRRDLAHSELQDKEKKKTIHNNTFRPTSSSTTLLFPTSIGEDLTAPGEETTQRRHTYVTPLFLAYQQQKLQTSLKLTF